MEHHAWLDESMTLSRNKAKPGECVLSCWEAPSAAVRVQATPWGLFCSSASHSSAGLESGRAAPGRTKGADEVVGAGAVRLSLVWGWCAPH